MKRWLNCDFDFEVRDMNSFGVGIGIFRDSWINIMSTDAQEPSVTIPPTAIVIVIKDKHGPVFTKRRTSNFPRHLIVEK